MFNVEICTTSRFTISFCVTTSWAIKEELFLKWNLLSCFCVKNLHAINQLRVMHFPVNTGTIFGFWWVVMIRLFNFESDSLLNSLLNLLYYCHLTSVPCRCNWSLLIWSVNFCSAISLDLLRDHLISSFLGYHLSVLQPITKYLILTPVSIRNSALQVKINVCFSRVFCLYWQNFHFGRNTGH